MGAGVCGSSLTTAQSKNYAGFEETTRKKLHLQ